MKKHLAKSAFLISALASLSSQSAAAVQQAKPCLPYASAKILITAFIPAMANGIHQQCASNLPKGSKVSLLSGYYIAQKYGADAQIAWQNGGAKIADSVAGKNLPDNISIEMARSFVDLMFTEMVASEISVKDCPKVERLYAELQPLPAKNLAGVIANIIIYGDTQFDNLPLRICN